jgi:hypothetical protein
MGTFADNPGRPVQAGRGIVSGPAGDTGNDHDYNHTDDQKRHKRKQYTGISKTAKGGSERGKTGHRTHPPNIIVILLYSLVMKNFLPVFQNYQPIYESAMYLLETSRVHHISTYGNCCRQGRFKFTA